MGSTYQIEFMLFKENRNNFRTENIRDTTLILCPSLHIFIGITPE